jgi:hypothetical protein
VGPGMAGEGWSINALGHIAGQMNFGTLGKQAFISYDGTDATHLGKLPGLASSFGFAINDQDDVVGQSAATGGSPYYAVLFQDGMVIPLPAFSLGREMALDISNSGFITGFSLYVGGPVHAFRILGNTITDIDSANPGGSEGLAVNELGHVAGWRTSLGVQLGYLYDGAMHTINCLPGDTSASAIGLDNLDRVVGYSSHEVGPAIIDSAFLWVSGMAFSLTELSSSHLFAGSRLNDAAHITDNGWICGTGYNSQTGRTEAYRMKVIVNVPKATAGIQL